MLFEYPDLSADLISVRKLVEENCSGSSIGIGDSKKSLKWDVFFLFSHFSFLIQFMLVVLLLLIIIANFGITNGVIPTL
jgi:hypothetical protein